MNRILDRYLPLLCFCIIYGIPKPALPIYGDLLELVKALALFGCFAWTASLVVALSRDASERNGHEDCNDCGECYSDGDSALSYNTTLKAVITLPNGVTLYRQPNGVGGYRYWSDEIGGGVVVWDTALVDSDTLTAAMEAEYNRQRCEEEEEDF